MQIRLFFFFFLKKFFFYFETFQQNKIQHAKSLGLAIWSNGEKFMSRRCFSITSKLKIKNLLLLEMIQNLKRKRIQNYSETQIDSHNFNHRTKWQAITQNGHFVFMDCKSKKFEIKKLELPFKIYLKDYSRDSRAFCLICIATVQTNKQCRFSCLFYTVPSH